MISVFGLFCLAGFYFAVEQNKRLAVKVLPQSGIFGSAGAQAGAIVLKKSGAEAVRLEFKKREWALVSPVQGPVDQVAVKNLLAALAGSESTGCGGGGRPGGIRLQEALCGGGPLGPEHGGRAPR